MSKEHKDEKEGKGIVKLVLYGVAAGMALLTLGVILWHRVLGWAHQLLIPWLQANMQGLVSVAEQAFEIIDDAVTTVKQAVAASWKRLRKHLLKEKVEIRRNDQNQPYKYVEAWIFDEHEQVQRIVVEEDIPWRELPAEAREQFIYGNVYEVDVTEERDHELMEYTLSS